MTGILLIDKPVGPTSHDVVARIRRVTGERRIDHTGTLDPRASGLLPLVTGRATRLASLFSGRDKTYLATIRLGFFTSTDDADGAPTSAAVDALPGDDAIAAALEAFRGTFSQTPPAHSAKKIDGQRAYDLARRAQPVELAPVTVTVHELQWRNRTVDRLDLELTVSAGFYVRGLARDLGLALGCGAHLAELRRTRSGSLDLAGAVSLADAERLGPDLQDRVIAPAAALAYLPAATVTPAGLQRVQHGNSIGPEYLISGGLAALVGTSPIRVLAEAGDLVAIAECRNGALHPVTVLG